MENKQLHRRQMLVMLFSLLLIIIGFISYSVYIYTFNHTLRECDSKDTSNDFSISIMPRTGQTDSWQKIVQNKESSVTYKGTIYDITIDNIGEYTISNWTLRLNITQDCYLNNAWCGVFEIHQNIDGKEQVQTIDLRNYKEEDLTLDYRIEDPDLMIPLHKGDYLIYHPDYASKEYPISVAKAGNLSEIVSGMILYNLGEESIVLDSYSVDFYLARNFFQSPLFIILVLASFIWFILWIGFLSIEINMFKVHKRFRQDEHIIRQSIGVFTQFFEAKDTYTNGHSQRVAKYSKLIADRLEYSEEQCRQIYYIALMHDCGKCCIPDGILKKPGKLTDEEYEIIKSHTVKGAEMLENFTAIEHIRDGVLYHHERYDGRGYPSGLAGEDIPSVGRLICIADSFDAMNSRRCYRDMLTKEYIISEFEKNKGKQFDPHMVDIFLELVAEGKINFSADKKIE